MADSLQSCGRATRGGAGGRERSEAGERGGEAAARTACAAPLCACAGRRRMWMLRGPARWRAATGAGSCGASSGGDRPRAHARRRRHAYPATRRARALTAHCGLPATRMKLAVEVVRSSVPMRSADSASGGRSAQEAGGRGGCWQWRACGARSPWRAAAPAARAPAASKRARTAWNA